MSRFLLASVLLLCAVAVFGQQEDERKYVGATELMMINTYVPETCDRRSKPGDRVNIKYVIRLPDGTGFAMAATYEFKLGAGEVIDGWDQGLVGMCVGENRKLIVPPHLGYGDTVYDPDQETNDPTAQRLRIPANSVLIFDTELLDLEEGQ